MRGLGHGPRFGSIKFGGGPRFGLNRPRFSMKPIPYHSPVVGILPKSFKKPMDGWYDTRFSREYVFRKPGGRQPFTYTTPNWQRNLPVVPPPFKRHLPPPPGIAMNQRRSSRYHPWFKPMK